jgi:hypothetical protein
MAPRRLFQKLWIREHGERRMNLYQKETNQFPDEP